MNIKKQPSGTALCDEERKIMTSLLVKLGYCVSIRKEKNGGGGLTTTVIVYEEQKG